MVSSYFTFFPVRDGEKHIGATLKSMVRQTIKPLKIIVVNDGSTDGTEDILMGYKEAFPEIVEIINTHSRTRDFSRIPSLWNWALKRARELELYTDYYLIGAGDVTFSPDYAEQLITTMDQNDKLVITSGDYGTGKSRSPHGAGRMIRQSFFQRYYGSNLYKPIIGYETEILERALCYGYEVKVIKEAQFEHLEKLGHAHGFKEFGYAMRALGYNKWFVLGRFALDFTTNKNVGKIGSIKMLYHYITYRPQLSGYYSIFDKDIRTAINNRQSRMMKNMLR